MVVIEYLKHWWLKRPRRLDTGKEAGSQPTFQATYLELCEVLGLKRRSAVYVEGNLTDALALTPCYAGVHHYGKFKSDIFINAARNMVPTLAHEMFHEYQHEYYPEEFVNRSAEQKARHELEADAFALAYCRKVNMNKADCQILYQDTNGNDREEAEILELEQLAEAFAVKFHLECEVSMKIAS